MSNDIIDFIKFLTGHDEKTILQIYGDWKKKPQKKESELPTANDMLGIYSEGETMNNIIELIQKKEKEGKIVIMTFEGLQEMNLKDMIKQPPEGILYDLNRDKMTVLTFIKDPKWINDYAVGLVITELKKQLEEK